MEKITLKYEWDDYNEHTVTKDITNVIASDDGIKLDKILNEMMDFLQSAGYSEKSIFEWMADGVNY